MEFSFFPAKCAVPAYSDSKFPALLSIIQSIGRYLCLQTIPLIALFVSLPFYIWMVGIAAIRILEKRNLLLVPITVLVILLAISAMVAPGMIPRYFLVE